MKRAVALVLVTALLLTLCGCKMLTWKREDPAAASSGSSEAGTPAPDSESLAEKPAKAETHTYPYLDGGYWRYQIKLDGELLPLEHDALIAVDNNEYNEVLYPVSEILDYFGVAYFFDEATGDFTTVINGVNASRDCNDGNYMWFSNQLDGYGNSVTPKAIDGVFYAPNYFFEHTIGATLTKISKGEEQSRGYIDVATNGAYSWGEGSSSIEVVRWDGDKYVGAESSNAQGQSGQQSGGSSGGGSAVTCSKCNGTGSARCTMCGGVGQTMTSQPVFNPVTGMQEMKQVFVDCPYCAGGYSVCGACGGTGSW